MQTKSSPKILKPENFGKVTWVSDEWVEYRWAIPEPEPNQTTQFEYPLSGSGVFDHTPNTRTETH